MKQLLRAIWEDEAKACPKPSACRFQTHMIDSRVEICACPKSVYYDYAPAEKLELDKHYTVADLPLKSIEDPEKVLAENMFYPDAIPLESNSLLEACFLNDGPCKANQELAVFERRGTAAYYKGGLSWGDSTYFQWVRKVLFYLPNEVRWRVQGAVTLKELNAQLVRLKATPDLALLLGSATSWLLVTMSRIKQDELINEQLYINNEQYRLDGWNNEQKAYSRLIKVVDKTMRGLANPTKAAKAAQAPTEPVAAVSAPQPEPQVEDVQPEQAEAIAEQAVDTAVQVAETVVEAISEVEEGKDQNPPEAERPKHTRVRKAPAAATPANVKALEDVLAYLGCPVADNMSQEDIDEEIRKCRDLGIVISRRMANLYAAGIKNYAKKLAAVRDALS